MEERILNLLKKHALSRKVILEFFSSTFETNKALDNLISKGEVVTITINSIYHICLI